MADAQSQYREHAPAPDLVEHLVCTWVGRIGESGVPYTDRVLPDGCMDIVWNGTSLHVAGPDTGPVSIAHDPGLTYVGVRFRPGRAPGFLGRPASELRDLRADLADLWGTSAAERLKQELATAPSPESAAAALESELRVHLEQLPIADLAIDALVARLRAPSLSGPGLVNRLAKHIGITERSLHRRCVARVGYGPKTLDRVFRFRRFLTAARSPAGRAVGQAGLAVASGYADQAHLARECRRLAGVTPSELFKTPS